MKKHVAILSIIVISFFIPCTIGIAVEDVNPPYATLIGNGEPLDKYVADADFSYHFSNDVLDPKYEGDTPIIEWVLHDTMVNENASVKLYYAYSSQYTPQEQWLEIDLSSPYIITSIDKTEINWTNEFVALGVFLYLTEGVDNEPSYLKNVRYWFYIEISDGIHDVSYWTTVDFGTYLIYDIFRWGDMFWTYTGIIIGSIAAIIGVIFVLKFRSAKKKSEIPDDFDTSICESLTDCDAELPANIEACEKCRKLGKIKNKEEQEVQYA